MKIEYRKADITDSELLIDIYNFAFYSDYIKYGECPAYGKTKEMMEKSIIEYPKFIILYNGEPVGCVSCTKVEMGIYEVGCLCVVPEFQGKGIGTQAWSSCTDRQHYIYNNVSGICEACNRYPWRNCGMYLYRHPYDHPCTLYLYCITGTDLLLPAPYR